MRHRFIAVGIALYFLLVVAVLSGLSTGPDARWGAAWPAVPRGEYWPATCALDFVAGLGLTGVGAAVLPVGLRAGWGRRLLAAAGFVGLSGAEVAQKLVIPVPPPTSSPPRGLAEPPWCRPLERQALVPGWGLARVVEDGLGLPTFPHPHLNLRFSFPSGHAMRLTYDMGLAVAGFGRGRAWAWGLMGAVMAVEGWLLVALRWHWPTDVLGGWLLASVVLAAVLPRSRRQRGRSSSTRFQRRVRRKSP